MVQISIIIPCFNVEKCIDRCISSLVNQTIGSQGNNGQLYHYCVNEDSTILKKNDTAVLDKLTIETLILEEYKKRGAYELFENHLFWGFIGRAYAGFLYHIFLRCDRIIVDINDLKKYIGACFPDYKQRINVDISKEAEENRLLFEVLASDKKYTMQEQEEIRQQYLTAMARTKGLL